MLYSINPSLDLCPRRCICCEVYTRCTENSMRCSSHHHQLLHAALLSLPIISLTFPQIPLPALNSRPDVLHSGRIALHLSAIKIISVSPQTMVFLVREKKNFFFSSRGRKILGQSYTGNPMQSYTILYNRRARFYTRKILGQGEGGDTDTTNYERM